MKILFQLNEKKKIQNENHARFVYLISGMNNNKN